MISFRVSKDDHRVLCLFLLQQQEIDVSLSFLFLLLCCCVGYMWVRSCAERGTGYIIGERELRTLLFVFDSPYLPVCLSAFMSAVVRNRTSCCLGAPESLPKSAGSVTHNGGGGGGVNTSRVG